jgi:antitoxin PrlF
VALYSGKDFPYLHDGTELPMIQSRITSKSQTTIPAPVRKALGLKEGDLVTYRIEAGQVVMTRAETAQDDPFATFSEWDSPEDRAAYGDL